VVTGAGWVDWEDEVVVPEESLCVAELLCEESSLCVLVDEPVVLGVVEVVADALPPFPRAATAIQVAANVARTPAVTRRRIRLKRCLTGDSGDGMPRIVADEAWIFLGIRSGSDKNRVPLRFLFDGS
jgi:hypothetical protein